MKLSAQPENLLEALALRSGLVPTPLGDTHVAFMLARTIMVATKLGIFEALADQPATAPQVAQRGNTAPEATRKMLNTLVHLGYLRLAHDQYELTGLSRRWLLQDGAQSVYDKMLFQFTEWEMVAGYEDYVRTGTPFQMPRNLHRGAVDSLPAGDAGDGGHFGLGGGSAHPGAPASQRYA